MNNRRDLDFFIKMDGEIVCELHPKVTQDEIVVTVQNLKKELIEYNLDEAKIFDIYDVSIEILQNMLKYSYGNKIDKNKKREADGLFIVSYHSSDKKFVINSSNLISDKQEKIIKERLEEIKDLNEKEIRKLLRTKMKLRKDGHANGAGLGFATIAMKVSEPIQIEFQRILENVNKYNLRVVI